MPEKPTNAYWAKRAEARMETYLRDSNTTLRTVNAAISRAQAQIERNIESIYRNFGTRHRLTEYEVKAILAKPVTKAEYDALLQEIALLPDGSEKRAVMIQADTGSAAYRLSQQEALKVNIRTQTAKIAAVEQSAVTKGLTALVAKAYSMTMYDAQHGTGIGFGFSGMNSRAIQEILKNPWSGKHYSSRVWQNSEALAQTLEETLTPYFMGAKSRQQAIDEITERMNVARFAAERLVRTETSYVANAAELAAYDEIGVERYEYLATLDRRTSKVCQELDGKVFLRSEVKVGVNYPPMHPHCRSTTVARFDDDVLEGMTRAARDPVTGESVKVPADMNYAEWLKMQHETYGEKRIEAARKMVVNETADRAQYASCKKAIGNSNMPKTFAAFQQMKYTDVAEWSDLKDYKKSVTSGDLSALTGFENYKAVKQEVTTTLVGITTSDGIVVAGYKPHYIDRTIGSYTQKREGVTPDVALQAIQNPDDIKITISKDGKRSRTYRNADAWVSINPDTKMLIQVNPARKRKP